MKNKTNMRALKSNPEQGFTTVEFIVIPAIMLIISVLFIGVLSADREHRYQERDTGYYGGTYGITMETLSTLNRTDETVKYPEIFVNWKNAPDTEDDRGVWDVFTAVETGDTEPEYPYTDSDRLNIHVYDMSDAFDATKDYAPGEAYCVVTTVDDNPNRAMYYIGSGMLNGKVIETPCEEYVYPG